MPRILRRYIFSSGSCYLIGVNIALQLQAALELLTQLNKLKSVHQYTFKSRTYNIPSENIQVCVYSVLYDGIKKIQEVRAYTQSATWKKIVPTLKQGEP